MLFLETSGYNYSKRRCENAVEWFVDQYLSKYKISIVVNHRGLYREGVFGWCSVEDCDYRPREFLIEIHNFMTVENYLKTLFHELWHVYQHVKGNLRDKGAKRLWKGIDCTNLEWEDQPWEIEAQKMEEVLYLHYLTFIEQ